MKITNPNDTAFPVETKDRSWATSHLEDLTSNELNALVLLLKAWYHRQPWMPDRPFRSSLLWEYIDRHGLGGMLGSVLMDQQDRPDDLFILARNRYFSNMLYFEQAKNCCLEIQRQAEALSIPLAFIKGPVLADEAYQDVGLRSFADIDLMVPSRDDGYRLAAALGVDIRSDGRRAGIVNKVRNPARLTLVLANWEVEIRYPLQELRDPLYLLIGRLDFSDLHKTSEGIYAPAPEWHIAFLVLHMATYHYFSRFVWFLDLAAVMRSIHGRLDWNKLTCMVSELAMNNQMAAVSHFCRNHIDGRFPQFYPVTDSWNYPFVRHLVRVPVIASGRYNKQHEKLRKWIFAYLFSMSHLFLMTDPPVKGPAWMGVAGVGILRRLQGAVGLGRGTAGRIFERCVRFGLLPMIWLLARAYRISILDEKDDIK